MIAVLLSFRSFTAFWIGFGLGSGFCLFLVCLYLVFCWVLAFFSCQNRPDLRKNSLACRHQTAIISWFCYYDNGLKYHSHYFLLIYSPATTQSPLSGVDPAAPCVTPGQFDELLNSNETEALVIFRSDTTAPNCFPSGKATIFWLLFSK